MKIKLPVVVALICTGTMVHADCGESLPCGSVYEGCCGCSEQSPWTVSLTHTVNYGTNLTLPIGLTPANTLLAPAGGLGGSIISDGVLGGLGLLDNVVGPGVPPAVDVPTGRGFQDDWMFRSTANIQYQKKVGDDGLFTLSYGYYQNLHADVKQLDLRSHTVSTQYAHQLHDHWTAALNYNYAYYELDNQSFVSQNNAGYGIAYRPDTEWSYEVNFNYSDSNFRAINSLDADFWSGTASATRYLNDDQTTYLSGGYQYGYWDARRETFSYDLNTVFLNLRKALNTDATTTLDLGGSYGNYSFRGIDFVQQDRRRGDDLFSLSSTLSKQLSDRLMIFAAYIYTDSESNVARQDYASNFFSSGFTMTF